MCRSGDAVRAVRQITRASPPGTTRRRDHFTRAYQGTRAAPVSRLDCNGTRHHQTSGRCLVPGSPAKRRGAPEGCGLREHQIRDPTRPLPSRPTDPERRRGEEAGEAECHIFSSCGPSEKYPLLGGEMLAKFLAGSYGACQGWPASPARPQGRWSLPVPVRTAHSGQGRRAARARARTPCDSRAGL